MLIGVDIGGTKCAVVLADESGEIQNRICFPTSDCRSTVSRIVGEVSAFASVNAIDAVGISCGGPLDAKRGLILSPPNLPGWDEVPICRILSEAAGAPALLCNDANACALAEWRFGAGKGTKNMIFLTFGTGLGAGLVLDGRLYEGAFGNAGEAGHIRLARTGPEGYGKKGSFEGFCSGGGIARMAKEVAEKKKMKKTSFTAKDLAQSAEEGDKFALGVYRRSARALGRGLAILADLFDPEMIVIGSVYARSRSLFEKEMTEIFRREALFADNVKIVPALLGDRIGDVAAVSTAILARDRGKENG
ncbi:MAG: ROK family protein [Clostridia bacterium]|nr:ROK family protein [Clostridia bacterium]